MSYTSIIHTSDPNIKASIIDSASNSNVTIDTHPHNKDGILVTGDSISHDRFLNLFKNNCSIFLDDNHPDQVKNIFKPHSRVHNVAIKPHITQGSNGGIAPWFAQYYNFPSQNGTAPVIAVISLGGWFQQSDLTHYFTNVCGLSSSPTILTYSVNGAPQPTFGSDTGADMENTLDLEICGSVCPGATIIFIYADGNSPTGFYNAFSAAVSGVTINSTFYQPTIVSCSWGASENYFDANTISTFNSIFQTGIAKNVNFTAASGDNAATDGVLDNNFHVDYPASSPYVVACGGTSVNPSNSAETLWSYNSQNNWGAGSGASAFSTMPSWQNGVAVLPNNTTTCLVAMSFTEN